MRRPLKRFGELEETLVKSSASPVVSMLPPNHQNDLSSILHDLQTTTRQFKQAIDNHDTVEPKSFGKVENIIERATKMSVWLKRLVGSYNLRGG